MTRENTVLKNIFLSLLLAATLLPATAQLDSSLVQFSGLVLSNDSLRAMPYTAVRNSRRKIVAITDMEGFFNMVVRKGDTVYFTQLGTQPAKFIVPQNLNGNKHSIVQLMVNDTIELSATIVRPWPTKREFDYEFVHGTFRDDELEALRQSVSEEERAKIAMNLPMDANENYQAYMNSQYQRYYWTGQTPPVRIMDPIAWSQFFKAWKSGKFKKKR